MEIWMRMILVASLRDCKALARKFANKDSRPNGSAMKSISSEKRGGHEVYDGFKYRRLMEYRILLSALEEGRGEQG